MAARDGDIFMDRREKQFQKAELPIHWMDHISYGENPLILDLRFFVSVAA